MKISGKKLSQCIVNIVLPRSDGDIVLIAKGITSYKEFEELCPIPKPPMRVYPDGSKQVDINDADYKKLVNDWAAKKGAWMVIKSLSETPGLEWESVDLTDPSTYPNFTQEFQDSGLSDAEISRIIDKVMLANGMNQEMITEAEKRFLAGQAAAQ